jgi:hypothetical protein
MEEIEKVLKVNKTLTETIKILYNEKTKSDNTIQNLEEQVKELRESYWRATKMYNQK